MASVLDYAHVLGHAVDRLGLVSAYHNSGAFTYPRGEAVSIAGWIGPPDPTIRAELRDLAVRVAAPYAASLAGRLISVWRDCLPGPAWVLPKSHWSFELDHGHPDWMPDALRDVDVDPAPLQSLPAAAAIVFEASDQDPFRRFVEQLLTRLTSSDFAVIFPDHRHLVTLHHHQQVWWQTPEPAFADRLREIGRNS